jgi:hypothetical protein
VFLHVGNNKNIREKNIIGIFDADTATVAATTRKFLSSAEKKGLVESASDEVPKSFVLYRERDGFAVCFSQLSTAALLGRSGNDQN